MMAREYGWYPFLDSSKEAVRSMGIAGSLDEKSIQLARARVMGAVLRRGGMPHPSYFEDSDVATDVRAYAAARLIISLLNRKILEFAESESARALEICGKNGDEEFLLGQLGIPVSGDGYVPLRAYLMYGSKFSVMLLSNRMLRKGFVKLQGHEIGVMLKEAVRSKVLEGLPISESLINDEIKSRLMPVVREIAGEISLRSPALGRQSRDIAPCMEKVIEELRAGSKVPHLKRWSLAVFLVKRGWEIERIAGLFANTPNFDEAKTKYQLQHVKEKGYSMPS